MKKSSNEPTSPNQSNEVFLCYSHADYQDVRRFYFRLKRIGVDVWLDKEKLLPGQNWQREIRKAILQSKLVIVCLSQHFNEKQGYRHKELQIALQKGRILLEDELFIIPVRLEVCDMPKGLQHLHRVDLFDTDGYQRLLYTLMERLKNKDDS
jgi:TIR domain-containing protein